MLLWLTHVKLIFVHVLTCCSPQKMGQWSLFWKTETLAMAKLLLVGSLTCTPLLTMLQTDTCIQHDRISSIMLSHALLPHWKCQVILVLKPTCSNPAWRRCHGFVGTNSEADVVLESNWCTRDTFFILCNREVCLKTANLRNQRQNRIYLLTQISWHLRWIIN